MCRGLGFGCCIRAVRFRVVVGSAFFAQGLVFFASGFRDQNSRYGKCPLEDFVAAGHSSPPDPTRTVERPLDSEHLGSTTLTVEQVPHSIILGSPLYTGQKGSRHSPPCNRIPQANDVPGRISISKEPETLKTLDLNQH